MQAETMMFGYRGWRRQWGDERHCGGALLWQLNDCWPTISWAIVDYFLRPKPAYYAVKRVLNPVAVAVRREHHDWSVVHAQPPLKSKYEVWVASNSAEALVGSVELRFISIESGKDLRYPVRKVNVSITANGTTDITDGVIDHIVEPEPYVLAARLWINGELVARDVDWPQPFKYIDLPDPQLKATLSPLSGDNTQTLTLTVKKPVKCLVIEEDYGIVYSDNALDIVPGDVQEVTITGLSETRTQLTYRFLGGEDSGYNLYDSLKL